MALEKAIQTVGSFGFLQRSIFTFNSLVGVSVTFQMLYMVFVGAKPEFECALYQPIDRIMNYTEMYGARSSLSTPKDIQHIGNTHCDLDGAKCLKFIYTANFTSIVTEWDLVCDKSYESSLGQSVFMGGVLTGAAIFGPVADKIGRKKTYFITVLGTMLSGVASAFAPSLTVFLILRYFAGTFCAGIILSAFVLMMEIIGCEWRPFCCILAPIVGSFAIALMSVLAYFVPNWREMSIVYAVAGIIFLPFFPLIPESPRWLYGKGRIAEAERLLLKIARRNGRKNVTRIQLEPLQTVHKENISIFALLRNLTLFKVTIIQVYSWFANCVVYYGLTMSAGELGSNMYVSVIISGLIEIPAFLIVLLLLKFIGRRIACTFFMVIGGIACVCIMFVPPNDTVVIGALAMTGKLGITASFQIIYLWSAEIFPTVIRNASMGLMSMAARSGGIIAPIVILLENYSAPLPYVVYGTLSFSAGVLNLFLPETKGQTLPQTIDDMLKLAKSKPYFKISPTTNGSINADDAEQRVQLLEEEICMNELEDEEDEVVEYVKTNTTAL